MAVNNFHVSFMQEVTEENLITANDGLRKFYNEVRLAFPTCKFGVHEEGGFAWTREQTERLRKIWVYLPEDYYAMGYIECEETYIDNTDEVESLFTVYSRKISNNKYSYGSADYYKKRSKNLKTAVKNAKAFLRPFTHKEIVDDTIYDFSSRASNSIHTNEKKVHSAEREVLNHKALLRELLALRELTVFKDGEPAPFSFLDADLDGVIAAYEFELLEAEHHITKFDAVCIRIVTRNDESTFYCNRVHHAHSYMAHSLADDTVTYDDSTVPTSYISKISILMGGERNDFVEGVGMKIDESIYYVVV